MSRSVAEHSWETGSGTRNEPSLVVLDVETLPVTRRWYIAHRMGKRLPPAAVAFRQFLLDEGAALLGQARDKTEKVPRHKAGAKRLPGNDARRGALGAARGKAG